MMRKLILFFFLVSFGVCDIAFACLEFYYDKEGQTHAVECRNARQYPDVKCTAKGDFYWDGKVCREVEIIKKCKKQRGTWRQVQLYPKPVFVNTCICSKGFLWNGEKCVNQLPSALKKDVVKVWCDSLRKMIMVYIPSANKLVK